MFINKKMKNGVKFPVPTTQIKDLKAFISDNVCPEEAERLCGLLEPAKELKFFILEAIKDISEADQILLIAFLLELKKPQPQSFLVPKPRFAEMVKLLEDNFEKDAASNLLSKLKMADQLTPCVIELMLESEEDEALLTSAINGEAVNFKQMEALHKIIDKQIDDGQGNSALKGKIKAHTTLTEDVIDKLKEGSTNKFLLKALLKQYSSDSSKANKFCAPQNRIDMLGGLIEYCIGKEKGKPLRDYMVKATTLTPTIIDSLDISPNFKTSLTKVMQRKAVYVTAWEKRAMISFITDITRPSSEDFKKLIYDTQLTNQIIDTAMFLGLPDRILLKVFVTAGTSKDFFVNAKQKGKMQSFIQICGLSETATSALVNHIKATTLTEALIEKMQATADQKDLLKKFSESPYNNFFVLNEQVADLHVLISNNMDKEEATTLNEKIKAYQLSSYDALGTLPKDIFTGNRRSWIIKIIINYVDFPTEKYPVPKNCHDQLCKDMLRIFEKREAEKLIAHIEKAITFTTDIKRMLKFNGENQKALFNKLLAISDDEKLPVTTKEKEGLCKIIDANIEGAEAERLMSRLCVYTRLTDEVISRMEGSTTDITLLLTEYAKRVEKSFFVLTEQAAALHKLISANFEDKVASDLNKNIKATTLTKSLISTMAAPTFQKNLLEKFAEKPYEDFYVLNDQAKEFHEFIAGKIGKEEAEALNAKIKACRKLTTDAIAQSGATLEQSQILRQNF